MQCDELRVRQAGDRNQRQLLDDPEYVAPPAYAASSCPLLVPRPPGGLCKRGGNLFCHSGGDECKHSESHMGPLSSGLLSVVMGELQHCSLPDVI